MLTRLRRFEPRLGLALQTAVPQDETTSAQAFEPTLESKPGPLASHAGDQLGKATTNNENTAGSEPDKDPQPTNVAQATDHPIEASVTQLVTTQRMLTDANSAFFLTM